MSKIWASLWENKQIMLAALVLCRRELVHKENPHLLHLVNKHTLKLRASQQNIPCKLSILGCLCMEERAFRKLSIDGNPDSTSIYDTALKLKELLVHIQLSSYWWLIIDVMKKEPTSCWKPTEILECCSLLHQHPWGSWDNLWISYH